MRTKQQQALRILVRSRDDFMAMRNRMNNRIGIKANGDTQDLTEEREFLESDIENFVLIANEARTQENTVEKMMKKALKAFPIYTTWLTDVKGVAANMASVLLSEFDIEKATTVSKMWQYAGLNPGMVRGKKRVKVNDYKPAMGQIVGEFSSLKGEKQYLVLTDEMIRGDRATPGFVLPFNKRLRTKLLGILAGSFIQQKAPYALDYYYPYKNRLEQSQNQAGDNSKKWCEVSPGHRDHAAKRYMIKMFLIDFYVTWRTVENLPVREPYQEAYLGHKHAS